MDFWLPCYLYVKSLKSAKGLIRKEFSLVLPDNKLGVFCFSRFQQKFCDRYNQDTTSPHHSASPFYPLYWNLPPPLLLLQPYLHFHTQPPAPIPIPFKNMLNFSPNFFRTLHYSLFLEKHHGIITQLLQNINICWLLEVKLPNDPFLSCGRSVGLS